MKEYRIISLENIPDGGLAWNYSADFPSGNIAGSVFVQSAVVSTINGKKWYGGPAVNSYLTFDMILYGLDFTKRIIMGCRAYSASPTQFALFGFLNISGNNGTAPAPVLGSTLGLTANIEYWIEMELDILNQTQNYYIDGKLVYTRAFTTAQIATVISSVKCLYFGGGYGAAINWYCRDMYIAHCNGVDDVVRLGPIDTQLAQFDTVTLDTGLTKGVGITDINALGSTMVDRIGSLFAPRVESVAGAGTGTMRLKQPVRTAGAIIGIQPFVSAQDRSAVPKSVSAQLIQNGSTQNLGSIAQTLAWKYSKGYGNSLLMTAPDGGSWDATKLNATDLKLAVV